MYDSPTNPDDLSPAGRRRREAILHAALSAAAGRRRRRAGGRAAAWTATLVVMGVGGWSVVSAVRSSLAPAPAVVVDRPVEARPHPQATPSLPPQTTPAGASPAATTSGAGKTPEAVPPKPVPPRTVAPRTVVAAGGGSGGPPRAEVVVTRIATDPTLVDQWAVRGPTPAVERLDDDGLQRALGSAGLSGGVVVRSGRAELWWQPVAARARATLDGRDF